MFRVIFYVICESESCDMRCIYSGYNIRPVESCVIYMKKFSTRYTEYILGMKPE